MSKENFAVVEAIQGEYHQGFKSREEAIHYVHQRLDEISSDQDYEFRTLLILEVGPPGQRLIVILESGQYESILIEQPLAAHMLAESLEGLARRLKSL